ncbi:MAG: hypothetical protein Q4C47_02850 [Planctomycetia bacterium]|nr:hypothetical protein [Planctomycetia bacterium]
MSISVVGKIVAEETAGREERENPESMEPPAELVPPDVPEDFSRLDATQRKKLREDFSQTASR